VFRTTSIVVLFAVIAPSFLVFTRFANSPESKLPVCCRRDGQHHCAMAESASAPPSGTKINALPVTCPFRSQAASVAHMAAYLPEASEAHFAGLISHPAVHEQTQSALRVSEARSHQKRGPPTTFPC
jgi:hypothetical protein